MRIIYMGTPEFAVAPLERICADGHEVVGVFTQPDTPQGRKMILTAPPVKLFAQMRGITVFQPTTFRAGVCADMLTELAPDLIIVVAYGKILPQYVLDVPRYGCINVHGSLLPRWRGAAPIQWSIIAGDTLAGVTTMQMDAGLDTGDMLLTYQTDIQPRETAGTLYERLSVAGAELLSETIRQMEQGTLNPCVQENEKSCYASMLDKTLAQIEWARTAKEIDCLIRGLNPWPIALTTLNDARIKIFAATPLSLNDTRHAAGTVICTNTDEGLVVACGEGVLRLDEIQAIGGKRMRACEYLRGHSIAVGTVLG